MTSEEQKQIFSRNLIRCVSMSGKTQKEIADAIGVSPQAFNTWCRGIAIPRMGKIQLLADYFGVSKSDLIDAKKISTEKKSSSVRLPVYGRIAAGIPLEMITDIEDWEEIPADMVDRGEFIALRIAGDSMEPRIRNGDVVIVRRQEDAETGDTIVATVNGCDATCKRLQKYADGIALLSNNQAYEPMIFTAQQVEELPVRILGKVVELRGKF